MIDFIAKLGDGFWKNKYLINQDQTSSDSISAASDIVTEPLLAIPAPSS